MKTKTSLNNKSHYCVKILILSFFILFNNIIKVKAANQTFYFYHEQIEMEEAIPILKFVDASRYGECYWTIHFTLTRQSNQLKTTYFNEQTPYDYKDNLEGKANKNPDTIKMHRPVIKQPGNVEAYDVFPYFIIARPHCDDGQYGFKVYDFVLQNHYPTMHLFYTPSSSREIYKNSIRVTLRSVLIQLDEESDPLHSIIEVNRVKGIGANASEVNCYRKICYPAYAAPLVLLNFPIFNLKITNQGLFEEYKSNIYVTPFHSRKNEGSGILEIAKTFQRIVHQSTSTGSTANNANKTVATTEIKAKHFFPAIDERIDQNNDKDLTAVTMTDLNGFSQTQIDSLTKEELKAMAKLFIHHPLDADDFYEAKFTFLSSPVAVIAGFYRPDVVLMADPDMERIELFRWDYNPGENATIFGQPTCFCDPKPTIKDTKHIKQEKLFKPIFAKAEPDIYYGQSLNRYYYRRRYAAMNYSNAESRAIFDVISLQDRLLLLTDSGVVSFYGNSNATTKVDKVLKSYPSEKLLGCFKFIRNVKRSLQSFDPILAVTFDYAIQEENNSKSKKVRKNQEVWFGNVTIADEPIKWIQINKDEYGTEHIHQVDAFSSLGIEAMTEDISEVVKICNLVKGLLDMKFFVAKDHIAFNWKTNDRHQCVAIDGSPVPSRPNNIQLLVKMSFTYFGYKFCDESNASRADPECEAFDLDLCMTHKSTCNSQVQDITLFIIAEHRVNKIIERGQHPWTITSIIPQIPCVVTHFEAIRTLPLFDPKSYFKEDLREKNSCFQEHVQEFENSVDIDRMTYTRQDSNHLFLYGRSFLHSSDAGKSFVFARDFPPIFPECTQSTSTIKCHNKDEYKEKSNAERYKLMKQIPANKVKLMAFASNSKYAILTSARELYIGSTGHHIKTLVRPNHGYAVISALRHYSRMGFSNGIPFSIMFDASDQLFELVALTDKNGTVVSIDKRIIFLDWVQRHQNFVDLLRAELKNFHKVLGHSPPPNNTADPFKYVMRDYITFCAFNQMELYQNYTKTWSRLQHYYFNPPIQHRKFGETFLQPALVNYQVSTFSLMHDAYLRDEFNIYSRVDKDPFEEWKEDKKDIVEIAKLQYNRKDFKKHGIVVEPRMNNRNLDKSDRASKILIDFFFLDYNVIVEFKMSFVTKTAYLPLATDFAKQKTSQIQLNVDNANGEIVLMRTDRKEVPQEAKVTFISYFQLNKTDALQQSTPGSNLVPIPITLHFVGGFTTCFNLPHYGMQGESITFQIMAGCEPATDLLFNWNTTLRSLRFRHTDQYYGDESYCYENNRVCFYAKRDITFHFETLDFTKQRFVPYVGKFKLKIIGGGYTNKSIYNYSLEEQEAYNIQGKSDVSLIWTTAGLSGGNETIEQYQNLSKDPKTQESVLEAGKTKILWSCNTLSPCARIAPSITGRTVYWFRVHITNRDVDPNTLCLHEDEFEIMVYGFPPSPELVLFVTLLFAVFTMLLLYVLFICCRNHRKVWRANKLRIWGWCLIVLDTIPKPLKRAEYDEQNRKDSIMLSLQGHLNVPKLGTTKPSETGGSAGVTPTLSKVSIQSQGSSSDLLRPIEAKKAPGNWTDMVYEQIISRRLLGIVERNKRMHESIMRKVDLVELARDLERRADLEGAREAEGVVDIDRKEELGELEDKDKTSKKPDKTPKSPKK